MKESTDYDVIVIGGGPAGLAAAISACNQGAKTLIIERDIDLGGILNQCIHSGFGLHYFNEELTGPEYADRFEEQVKSMPINVLTKTMVLNIDSQKNVYFVNPQKGYSKIKAGAIVLAMGCRERTRGAIAIPGDRPSGIFTAGTAQRFINIEGYMVGKRVVILGSGDIGLIMARRMTLEGAKVLACIEIMPYSGGLTRNIVQCLDDYDIPLYLSHTITDIKGRGRLESITVSKVNSSFEPVTGTEFNLNCDTLLLSVGLIPENELSNSCGIEMDRRTKGALVSDSLETNINGIFACGNVLHVHDLVDFVTKESEKAGHNAALFAKGQLIKQDVIPISAGEGISYTVPQKFSPKSDELSIFFRVKKVFSNVKIIVTSSGKKIASFKREHCLPAEMEKINIPKKLINNIEDELTVMIEE